MTIEIKIKEDPPRELIRVIEECYSPVKTIKNILIDIDVESLSEKALAGFNPKTGQVVLDLDKCLIATEWIDQGLMRIQAVWFNMLRAIFHEGVHAEQLEANPKLIKEKVLPAVYEQEAEEETVFRICGWAEGGGLIPKLNEMGWAGGQIKSMANRFYADGEVRPLMMEELELLECNGCAELETFAECNKEGFSKKEHQTLCELIDIKEQGVKLGTRRYLDTLGFFGFLLEKQVTREKEKKKQAKSAQDRANEDQT